MNVGAWDRHHGDLATPRLYGDRASYGRVASLVRDCDTVADWGCGGGGLRGFLHPAQVYVGVDGSRSPYADVRADLRHYRCVADAVVLRHVLEHNDEWQLVLDNALASATRRLVIALFTPLVSETRVMFREPDHADVPVIAFKLSDITDRCGDNVSSMTAPSPGTAFGVETFVVIER